MFLSICKAVFTTLKTDLIGNKYISLKSSRINYTNVSLIIFKGNHIKADNYIGIAKHIQDIGAQRGLNIDIKIPYQPYVQNIKEYRQPSFLLGHSSGVYDLMMFHNITKYDGLIQIGSTLNGNGILPWKSQKLQQFPIPVLTLVGEKDGYLRHTYCLDEVYNQNETEKYITKPIVVMKDITHLHISNTSSSNVAKFFGLSDLKSSIDIQKAWHMLSSCIVDFMLLNVNNNYTNEHNNSLERIMDIQSDTQVLLNTYSKYDSIQYILPFIYDLNSRLSLSLLNVFNSSVIFFDNYYDFLLSKPSEKNTSCYRPKKSYIFSKTYFTPLWIKTKYEKYLSAKHINEDLFWKIAKNLNFNVSYKSYNIVFKEDKRCFTTLEWLLSKVTIDIIDNTIFIQSPVFITDENTWGFKNFYYLKTLSPAQISELIIIDLQ
jgi:hypothetical protein